MTKYEEKYKIYSQKMIFGLIALMEQMPFQAITTTDVCRAAGVIRSTFYAHYHNTSDLLDEAEQWVLEDFSQYWNERVRELTFPYWNQRNLECLLEYTKRNPGVVKAFFREPSEAFVRKTMGWVVEHIVYPHTKASGDRIYAEYIARFYMSSVRAVILFWIERGCRESTEEICQIIMRCVDRRM